MASHAGPTGLALLLFVCIGTSLPSTKPPISGHYLESIIIELKDLSEKLLESYRKDQTGLPESIPYPGLSFASYCRPPHYINSSAIKPYFVAIKSSFSGNAADLDDIIQQLKKLDFSRELEIQPVPKDSFNYKRFVLAILQEFWRCVHQLLPLS